MRVVAKLLNPLNLVLLLTLMIMTLRSSAQDIVVISDGNFLRGTIKGMDLFTVLLENENESIVSYSANDIKEFVWNGQTYVSKPIVIKKNMLFRFFKIIESGAVNLYSVGGTSQVVEPVVRRAKVRPSIGIGAGSGGFGGVGLGGGITIGGGRNREPAQAKAVIPTTYFIEKPGTGPMQEIFSENGNAAAKTEVIKSILLQKLTNDDDLGERIKATESFDSKLVVAFIKAYNAMKK